MPDFAFIINYIDTVFADVTCIYSQKNPALRAGPTLCCTTKCTSVSYSSLRICIGNEPLSLFCTMSFSQSFRTAKRLLMLGRQK